MFELQREAARLLQSGPLIFPVMHATQIKNGFNSGEPGPGFATIRQSLR